jgi:serine/threonine protein phosphatase PrpC
VLSFAAKSHPGLVREANEDALIANAGLGLFAVADGLGGHLGGEIASRIAADTIADFVATSRRDSALTWPYGVSAGCSLEGNRLRNAVLLANREILHRAQAEPEHAGMGSTVIAVSMVAGGASYVAVGDSRLHRWRQDALTQLSEDDTWVAAMVRAGAAAGSVRHHQMRHMLTKALGSVAELAPQVRDLQLDPGDLLLLCSDGLHGPLGDDGIARVLAARSADLDATASALIDAANAAGGPDNITVVLVRDGG